MERAREIAILSISMKFPSSAGFRYFLFRDVNQLLFLSFPDKSSPSTLDESESKKKFEGYDGHTIPNSGDTIIDVGQQYFWEKYFAESSVFPFAPPFSSDTVGLYFPIIDSIRF